MQIVTTDFITGKEIETIQMVKGSVVFSKNVARDFCAAVKTLVGGEIAGYTEMLNDARNIATQRMVDEASDLGADAVVNMRFMTSSVMAGASEIIAYGTAVKFSDRSR